MEPARNEFLWRKAKKRASFQIHFRTYAFVNAGLWLIFIMTTYPFPQKHLFPWPIFPMIGWGIGLASHYLSAYANPDEKKLAEREYEKLLQEI